MYTHRARTIRRGGGSSGSSSGGMSTAQQARKKGLFVDSHLAEMRTFLVEKFLKGSTRARGSGRAFIWPCFGGTICSPQ